MPWIIDLTLFIIKETILMKDRLDTDVLSLDKRIYQRTTLFSPLMM